MKKAELLNRKVLKATAKMLGMAKSDKGELIKAKYTWDRNYRKYKHYTYYRAIEEDEILTVAIYLRSDLASGGTVPYYQIYLDKKENDFITYNFRESKWSNAKIDLLKLDYEYGRTYGEKSYSSVGDKKIVNNYLQRRLDKNQGKPIGTKEIEAAVLDYQFDVRSQELARKHRSELTEIDGVMNTVPAIPKDFIKWCENSALYASRYIFYKAERNVKEGYCSHCKEIVPIKGPKRNKKGKCPNCNSNILYKPWKGQKNILDEIDVTLAQQLTDGSGIVLRRFHVGKLYKQDLFYKNNELVVFESERKTLNQFFEQKQYYEFGEYKSTGIRRWCYQRKQNYFNYWNYSNATCLYTPNLRKVFKETKLKYIPIKTLLNKHKGDSYDVRVALQSMEETNCMEFLIKAGLHNLAWDVFKGSTEKIKKEITPWECLGIKKRSIAFCKEMDITYKQLLFVQEADEVDVLLTKEQIVFMENNKIDKNIVKYMKGTTPHKMLRYIKENISNQQRYMDYLNMRCQMKYDLSNSIILYPRNLQEEHDKITIEVNENKAMLRMDEVRNKFPDIRTNFESINNMYGYDSDIYFIRPAKSAEEIVQEGRSLHHCVGGDSYLQKHNNGESYILLLRQRSNPKKPFITVEIKNNEIKQWYAAHDKKPEEIKKDIDMLLAKYCKLLSKKIERKAS